MGLDVDEVWLREHQKLDHDAGLWVVVKSSRIYYGGLGYAGPSWGAAGLKVPTHPFCSRRYALEMAAKLKAVNSIGFGVHRYRPLPEDVQQRVLPLEER